MNVGFCIVGALVAELQPDATPRRMTNDADALVGVESLADFERLKDGLADFPALAAWGLAVSHAAPRWRLGWISSFQQGNRAGRPY